jgi:hypothetical protein
MVVMGKQRAGKIGHSEGFILPKIASDCRGFCRAAASVLIGWETTNQIKAEIRPLSSSTLEWLIMLTVTLVHGEDTL